MKEAIMSVTKSFTGGATEEIVRQVADIGWEVRFAKRAARMRSSIIRELLKYTLQPDIISFAGGMPAPELFPVREFDEACRYVLANEAQVALQYSPTEGYIPLKEWLAETMSKYSIWVEPENILMTNGSQQGLDLLGKLFVDAGTCIITSAPTYLGALQAWNAYEARYSTVPLDDEGMQVEELAHRLRCGERPCFVYVLPNFHNPAGTTLPLERREQLAQLAREHDLVIIEDDPYGELRYEGEHITPIFRLAPERTIYLSTFSKTLAPGIRLAWMVAPKPIISRLVQAKQGADLHTSTFLQMITYDICRRGILRQHVKGLRQVYRRRRDTMLETLEEHWPQETHWTRPQGGLFLWARVPETINTQEFLAKALAAQVAYVPGSAFYPGEEGGNHAMRLNFSNADEAMINEGIYRLGVALKEELAGKSL
jgi:2-aminoadipate transaminase